jgi:hypothetical protein
MSDRRTFLKHSLAGISALSIPGTAFSFEREHLQGAESPFRYVLFDPEVEASRQFARISERLGSQILAVKNGELGELWYGFLRDDLRENPGLVAGLHDNLTSFQVHTLSHDIWHYTMLRSEHTIHKGTAVHRFESFGKELGAEEFSTTHSPDWPKALAEDLHTAAWQTLEPRARPAIREYAAGAVSLESWVIGPMHASKPV